VHNGTAAPEGGVVADASASPDGGPPDGGPQDAGPVNLLDDPGFEEPTSGCAGWNTSNATAVRITDVTKSGSGACLVCPLPTSSQFFELMSPPITVNQGGRYYAEAFLRAPADGSVAGSTGVSIAVAAAGGDTIRQANQVTLGGTWLLSSLSFDVSEASTIQFAVHGYEPNGGCAVVDDAALYAR
jgi:hypothetical protein